MTQITVNNSTTGTIN